MNGIAYLRKGSVRTDVLFCLRSTGLQLPNGMLCLRHNGMYATLAVQLLRAIKTVGTRIMTMISK